jgi:hypothetical protein
MGPCIIINLNHGVYGDESYEKAVFKESFCL